MNAPTVTLGDIQAKIVKTEYWVIPDTTVTICMITLENGFSVRGESACVSKETFNIALGEKYAYEKAFDKIWELEGYLLANKLWLNRQIENLASALAD